MDGASLDKYPDFRRASALVFPPMKHYTGKYTFDIDTKVNRPLFGERKSARHRRPPDLSIRDSAVAIV